MRAEVLRQSLNVAEVNPIGCLHPLLQCDGDDQEQIRAGDDGEFVMFRWSKNQRSRR